MVLIFGDKTKGTKTAEKSE